MSSYFEPEKHSKTIEIPVRVKGNKIEFFYDGELPDIQDGVLCRLIVPANGVDKQNQQQLSSEKVVSFLPKGSRIFMAIKIGEGDKVDAELLQRHIKRVDELTSEIKNRSAKNILQHGPVEIILRDELRLTLRGTKRAKLEYCSCYIPLIDIEVGSLNQAYTKISEEFEKQRSSHTGSAFRSMYHFEQVHKECISLDDLRGMEEAKDERLRFVNNDADIKSGSA